MIIIWIISFFTYLFIGGLLNGLVNEPDEEMQFAAIMFWPVALMIWLGDEFGQFVRRVFKF
jgi:hypothetical protein